MSPRIWLDNSVVILISWPRGNQGAGQHAVIPLDPNLTVEADLRKVCQAVGIVRVCLVRRHVERCLGMASIDADRWQAFCDQPMIEPHR